LQDNCRSAENIIIIVSASALSDAHKNQLQQKLSELCERSIEPEYRQDSRLIAGLRLIFGAWVLHLNLEDELKGFADLIDEQSPR